jgi:hypothetical protein
MVMYLATVADTQYRDTNLENGRVNVFNKLALVLCQIDD